MWICQCQTKNKLKNRTCSICQSPIPPEERKRIYKYELDTARKEIGLNYSNSSVLTKLDNYADNDDKSFLEVLSIIALSVIAAAMLIYKNFRKLLPYASVVAVIVCIITLSNPYNKHILRQKKEVSTARRSIIAENMSYKLGTIREGFSEYLNAQKTTLNGEEITKTEYVDYKINLAKLKGKEFLSTVTDSAMDYIDNLSN